MSIENENNKKLEFILDKYELSSEEKEEFFNIIKIIYVHEEFQRRMTSEFKHHGEITLGCHILEDAVMTYILSKEYINKTKTVNYDIDLAVKIAMLHDLYTVPWQNNEEEKLKNYFNKHGFRHPIEAVLNANAWYPELFDDSNSEIIIDSIVHHMFPYPVTAFKYDEGNRNELENFELISKLSERNRQILIESSNRNRVGLVSFSRCLYPEGVIMSKVDKKISINQIKDLGSATALITGRNKTLEKEVN